MEGCVGAGVVVTWWSDAGGAEFDEVGGFAAEEEGGDVEEGAGEGEDVGGFCWG